MKGIEPSSSAWKAIALPLSYTRNEFQIGDFRLGIGDWGLGNTQGSIETIELNSDLLFKSAIKNPKSEIPIGGCRIRTYEGISHQIYSLTRLTASVTPRLSLDRERRRPVCSPACRMNAIPTLLEAIPRRSRADRRAIPDNDSRLQNLRQ